MSSFLLSVVLLIPLFLFDLLVSVPMPEARVHFTNNLTGANSAKRYASTVELLGNVPNNNTNFAGLAKITGRISALPARANINYYEVSTFDRQISCITKEQCNLDSTYNSIEVIFAYMNVDLPPPGQPGRIICVAYSLYEYWLDTGAKWISLSDDTINVDKLSTNGDGTAANKWTGWEAPLRALITSGLPVSIHFPKGNYYSTLARVVNVDTDRVHVWGDGEQASVIYYNPSAAGIVFNISKPLLAAGPATTGDSVKCSIRGIGFVGMGTQQKVAVRAVATSGLRVENIATSSWTGNSGSSATPSIGVQLRGHEITSLIHLSSIFADRPISIEPNPNDPNIGADHLHIQDLYASAQVSTEANIAIDPAMNVTNFTMDGTNSMVAGKYGIYWSGPGGTGTSLNWNLQNIRFEQSADATGYSVYLNHAIQNVTLSNVALDPIGGHKGAFFRNLKNVTLNHVNYTGTSGVAVDADGTNSNVEFRNCFFQVGSTLNLSGLKETFAAQPAYGTAAPATRIFDTNLQAAEFTTSYGVRRTLHTGALAAGATYELPYMGAGAFIGTVTITAYSATGPVNAGGVWAVTRDTTTPVSLISGTTNVAAGNVATKLCVFSAAPGANAPIQILNNTGASLTYVVSIDWTP